MVQELDSGKLMYSVGNNDECYTPDYGVKPILKYIPEGAMSGVLLIPLIVSLLNKYRSRIKLLLLILVWV